MVELIDSQIQIPVHSYRFLLRHALTHELNAFCLQLAGLATARQCYSQATRCMNFQRIHTWLTPIHEYC